jgi:ferredoxin-nitrate reductase
MSERVTDVWGRRPPFSARERWPDRVDRHLTVEEARVERWVPSVRVLCSNGCGPATSD